MDGITVAADAAPQPAGGAAVPAAAAAPAADAAPAAAALSAASTAQRPPARGQPRGPNYKPAETLATCLSALEANEAQADQSDEMKFAAATDAFPRQLKMFTTFATAEKYSVQVIQPAELPAIIYHRTTVAGKIHERFMQMKRECNNVIMSLWKKLLDSNGGIPSGTNIDDVLSKLRQSLWIHEHPAADPKVSAPASYKPHGLLCFIAFGPPAAHQGREVVPCFAGDGLALQAAAVGRELSRSEARAS